MANNVLETLVGAAVLAAAAGFAYVAAGATGTGVSSDSYALSASFRSLSGVGPGTDVRVAGVKVGTISDISLDSITYEAVAQFTVSADLELPEDSDARILADGLLGGNYVSITPGASDFMLVDGDEILNTQGSVSLLDLFVSFAGSSND
ncbi:outer membrane lipid asymmetry maintenance protein MlaD [Pontivivens insulae]|uniref:Putative phospholipid ABC transporter-binding protein MlaD n=1 Tax=Pontivivens insulae TaxID=1639689 RepID=A0A2R8ABJ7_9RHOB|nr:outer membrane lipid asymmetry maintenance protein MlaD [Pontivivens insulae]RED11362.1 phospholipid/cholesterol/gamma-HCH transport system substrate-binding protein [Pontivivens insulae]SPF29465.1 putative phospholipid ABC transporter-binding protein MlaD [Pontivivens insulae]